MTEEGSNEIDDDILSGVDSDNDTTKDDNDILSRKKLVLVPFPSHTSTFLEFAAPPMNATVM